MKKKKMTVAFMLQREKVKKQWIKEMKELHPEILHIELLAIMKTAEEAAEDKKKKLKQLTAKEQAAIKKEVGILHANLMALPPFPFEKIVPAPGISSLNAAKLYLYVNDKYPKIQAMPEFAACSPTVLYVKAISDALYPYAMENGRKMSGSDLETRDTLTAQCKEQFQLMMLSCALLASGNKALFLLTGVACKRKGVKRNIQKTPPNFKLDTNKGVGRIGVVIEKVEFAENYTVFYGPKVYDKATWNSQTGGLRQVIEDQVAGAELNVIVRANGKGGSSTDNSNPQSRVVPHN